MMTQKVTDRTITSRDGSAYELDHNEIKHLEYRCESTRRTILDTLYRYGRGHSGPSFSLVEILVTLYLGELRVDAEDPKWPNRDRFILSKGHGALGYYAVLAECGLIPKEELATYEEMFELYRMADEALRTVDLRLGEFEMAQEALKKQEQHA